MSFKDFEKVIHAFISSWLDYCNGLYVGVGVSQTNRLQLVQKAAARLLTGSRKINPITPILAFLHWLPMHFSIDFKILLFVFKALHGQTPPYLSELLVIYTPPRSLRSADQMLLTVPRSRLKNSGDQAFATASARLWNNLRLHIRISPAIDVFLKTSLKSHFYSLAFKTPDLEFYCLILLLLQVVVHHFGQLVVF